MSTSEILEALMLAAFSVGWYWSIFYMLMNKRAYGKSGGFVCFTIIGYGMGLKWSRKPVQFCRTTSL